MTICLMIIATGLCQRAPAMFAWICFCCVSFVCRFYALSIAVYFGQIAETYPLHIRGQAKSEGNG